MLACQFGRLTLESLYGSKDSRELKAGRSALSRIELALTRFEHQLNDTVVVCCSETVALELHELGTSIFGLLACRVKPDHLSPDFGHAHVEIASSGDRAKLVRHRGGPFWKRPGGMSPVSGSPTVQTRRGIRYRSPATARRPLFAHEEHGGVPR